MNALMTNWLFKVNAACEQLNQIQGGVALKFLAGSLQEEEDDMW